MRCFWLSALTVTMLVTTATSARAESPIVRHWRKFWHDAKMNNMWPEPYVLPDEEAARAPFRIMVAKGWQVQCTLNAHYFEDGGGLGEAGKERVMSIMRNVPPEYRQIFVERDLDPDLTQARVEAVQEFLGIVAGDQDVPPVSLTNERARGWPALEVDTTRQKFLDTTPEPRLPERQSFTEGN